MGYLSIVYRIYNNRFVTLVIDNKLYNKLYNKSIVMLIIDYKTYKTKSLSLMDNIIKHRLKRIIYNKY